MACMGLGFRVLESKVETHMEHDVETETETEIDWGL